MPRNNTGVLIAIDCRGGGGGEGEEGERTYMYYTIHYALLEEFKVGGWGIQVRGGKSLCSPRSNFKCIP